MQQSLAVNAFIVDCHLPPVTLREVARAAGVSTASASRALSRSGAVSVELRRRIEAAAERLGYRPNLAARSLAARRSGLVGVIVQNPADPFMAEIVVTLECRLAEAGYALVVAAVPGSSQEALGVLRGLLSRGVEGCVLARPAHARELADVLRDRGVASIALAPGEEGVGPVVMDGRRRGAELTARYLLSLGHRTLGVISTDAATIDGAADALADNGVSLPPGAARRVPDVDTGAVAMRLLLDGDKPPTAVICGSDLQAVTIMRMCLLQGIAVPGEVSIAGFGDAAFARRVVPALTTVRVAPAQIGLLLAEGLLSRLGGATAPPAIQAPVKLVVRESTAAPSR